VRVDGADRALYGRRGGRSLDEAAGASFVFRALFAFFAGLARFLLFAVALLFLSRLLGRGLRRRPASRRPGERPAERLVRDPVCGVRLPESRALRIATSDGDLFFCSESCRNRHRERASR